MGVAKLQSFKEKVDTEIENFFNAKLEKAQDIDKSSVELIKLLKSYNLGAPKRIRAAMLYYGYRCISKKNLHEALKAAMSIELLQSYFLIHDDIMDRSDLRRGKPALHKAYESIGKKRYKNYDPHQFGLSMALLAGDILVAFGDEIIADLDIKPKYKTAAIKKFQHINHTVLYGQVLDILSNMRPTTIKDVSLIHRMKTASYTVEGPTQMGAILAGASKKQLKLLAKYGIPLGKAFQIQDDILGLFGKEKKTGKPADSDLKEGKQTLLILKALEKANPKQKNIIKNALGNQKLTKKHADQVRKIVKQTGSLEFCQNKAREMIETAKTVMQNSRFRKEGKEFLISIADYMLDREY